MALKTLLSVDQMILHYWQACIFYYNGHKVGKEAEPMHHGRCWLNIGKCMVSIINVNKGIKEPTHGPSKSVMSVNPDGGLFIPRAN